MNWKKKIIPILLLVVFMASMSACNRGVGCPNSFSISQTS